MARPPSWEPAPASSGASRQADLPRRSTPLQPREITLTEIQHPETPVELRVLSPDPGHALGVRRPYPASAGTSRLAIGEPRPVTWS